MARASDSAIVFRDPSLFLFFFFFPPDLLACPFGICLLDLCEAHCIGGLHGLGTSSLPARPRPSQDVERPKKASRQTGRLDACLASRTRQAGTTGA